jgi:pimeloyl-ACP methyl ester carboxylesterase
VSDDRKGIELPGLDGLGNVTWLPVSRTAAFMARSSTRSLRADRDCVDLRTHLPSAKLAVGVWMDEMLRGVAAILPGSVVDEAELGRVSERVDAALALFDANGWLDDPVGLHPAPPPPHEVSSVRRSVAGVRYQHLRCDSEFDPPAELTGHERAGADGLRQTHAYVLEHRGEARPWLVQLHGWMMGGPLDLVLMRSLDLHRRLGFNVIHPVAPLHGPRRVGSHSGDGMFSIDYVANVHAMSNALWDARRWIAHVRALGAPSVAVHGISLGGFLTALLAGLEPDLDAVVSGAPPASLDLLLARGWRGAARRRLREHGLIGPRSEAVHRVVSPLAFTPLVAPERRFIYAAVGDRATTAQQAYRLWLHWDRPEVRWHHGSHLTLFGRDVHRFLERALSSTVDAGRPMALV